MKNYVVLSFGEYKKRQTIFCRTLGIRMSKVNAERKIGTFYNKNHKIRKNYEFSSNSYEDTTYLTKCL